MKLNYTSRLLMCLHSATSLRTTICPRSQPNYSVILERLTTSAEMPFFAIQKFNASDPKSKTRPQWCIFFCYNLKHTCRVKLILVQVLPLKSVLYARASSLECWTTVRHNMSRSIFFTPLCDSRSYHNATFLGIVTRFPVLALCNTNRVLSSVRNARSIRKNLLLPHRSWEVRTLGRCRLPLSNTMVLNCDSLSDVPTSPPLSKSINF